SFQKGTLEKVTEVRQNIMNLNIKYADIGQLPRNESLNQQLMHNLNVVLEYYTELKANDIHLKILAEIDEHNENVCTASTIHNRNVEMFNNQIQIFPHKIINNMLIRKKVVRPFRDQSVTQNFDYRPNFH